MVENGIYTIKQNYFEKFKKQGCKFKDNKLGKRPVFCCVEDKIIKGIFWAIPTSEITENKNMKRIEAFVKSKTANIKSSFYHIGVTNKPCIFCISSCFPIIEKYIEKEYIVAGKHLILDNVEQNNAIKKKLRRILNAERLNPNRFEQKITHIKEELMEELKFQLACID